MLMQGWCVGWRDALREQGGGWQGACRVRVPGGALALGAQRDAVVRTVFAVDCTLQPVSHGEAHLHGRANRG